MEKKFKNKFGVRGSIPLLKAFREEAEKLGWKYDDGFISWKKLEGTAMYDLYFNNNTGGGNMLPNHFSLSRSSDSLPLPEDWDKALKLASEIEEEVKVPETRYYKYRRSSNQSFTISKIYKLRDSHSLNSSFAFIDDYGRNNGWGSSNEDYFTPATQAEFDAQELEFKMKELLKKAKKEYPIGTKYLDAIYPDQSPYIVEHSPTIEKGNIVNGDIGYLYANRQWATVVEDEFKVEDVVVALRDTSPSEDFDIKRGTISKITKFSIMNYLWLECIPLGEGVANPKDFRKATSEEIAKYKQSKEAAIEIAGYKAEIKNNKIAFGCKKFSKEDLEAISRVFNISDKTGLKFFFSSGDPIQIIYEDESYDISDKQVHDLINKL